MVKGESSEVGARLARATSGGVGCRTISGGHTMTISPDLVYMRLDNTEQPHGTACTCVQSRPLERGVPSRPLESGLCTGRGVSGGD